MAIIHAGEIYVSYATELRFIRSEIFIKRTVHFGIGGCGKKYHGASTTKFHEEDATLPSRLREGNFMLSAVTFTQHLAVDMGRFRLVCIYIWNSRDLCQTDRVNAFSFTSYFVFTFFLFSFLYGWPKHGEINFTGDNDAKVSLKVFLTSSILSTMDSTRSWARIRIINEEMRSAKSRLFFNSR